MIKNEEFRLFLSQLSETNTTLDSFTDFEKVRRNIEKVSIKLNQLNYLIGKESLEEAIHDLYEENPKAFQVLDILIAVRKDKKTRILDKDQIVFLDYYFSSPQLILEYFEKTGLAEIFRNKEITNLVDYVFGIEVGLDTNARKNRGGESMSKTISQHFESVGITYRKEVSSTTFPEIISLGADVKRFDFVIDIKRKTYLIEANYYNTGGSKLNEVARSYIEIASKIQPYSNYEFVWITDGQGWLSAKNKLEEAYYAIPSIYNLVTLKEFIENIQKELS
ncbi:type II restriction endonuclease [Candidatus Nitrosacidococcus sp. I8]|uniref:type II restriction endonuclease n=1 Tax=Candidatus Nitrosacidococcus sp. I8 TaxID=2942908 RepID=UPI002225FDA0|nr:type II restriction endonuclease [Candidatus Nitrosacidococcus sp. I8]CAH9017603.1 Type-2 restriction enzyme MboI [Candidatus Nitrosacidococcus sp. I8]